MKAIFLIAFFIFACLHIKNVTNNDNRSFIRMFVLINYCTDLNQVWSNSCLWHWDSAVLFYFFYLQSVSTWKETIDFIASGWRIRFQLSPSYFFAWLFFMGKNVVFFSLLRKKLQMQNIPNCLFLYRCFAGLSIKIFFIAHFCIFAYAEINKMRRD